MNDVVNVVSGLPRSGTSMMMKMLEAGGLEPMVDYIRNPDEDNPKGYYEYERVKRLKEDASWMGDAHGKVLKVISMLLYDLPKGHYYRIVFMRRKLEETLASQQRMMNNRGEESKTPDDLLQKLYAKHLQELEKWLSQQDNMDVLYVSYNDALQSPVQQARRVAEFLDADVNPELMAAVVDSSLYRNRA